MVRLEGIEPPTLGLEVRRSIQLSYRRIAHLRYTAQRAGGRRITCRYFLDRRGNTRLNGRMKVGGFPRHARRAVTEIVSGVKIFSGDAAESADAIAGSRRRSGETSAYERLR